MGFRLQPVGVVNLAPARRIWVPPWVWPTTTLTSSPARRAWVPTLSSKTLPHNRKARGPFCNTCLAYVVTVIISRRAQGTTPGSGWPVGRSRYFPGGPRVLPLLRAASMVTTSCARRAWGTTLSSGQPARSPHPAPEGPQIPLLIQATWPRDPTPTGWPRVWSPDQTAWCGNTAYHQRGPKFCSMLEPASKGTPPLARRAGVLPSAQLVGIMTPPLSGRAWGPIPGSSLLAQ